MADTQHPNRNRPRNWIAVLSGPVLWTVHFMVVYLLTETVCKTPFLDFALLNVPGATWLMLGLTLLLSLTTFAMCFWSAQAWEDEGVFMLRAAALLNGVFMFIILAEGLPLFFLRPC